MPHPGAAGTGRETLDKIDRDGSSTQPVLETSSTTECICFSLDYFLSPLSFCGILVLSVKSMLFRGADS